MDGADESLVYEWAFSLVGGLVYGLASALDEGLMKQKRPQPRG